MKKNGSRQLLGLDESTSSQHAASYSCTPQSEHISRPSVRLAYSRTLSTQVDPVLPGQIPEVAVVSPTPRLARLSPRPHETLEEQGPKSSINILDAEQGNSLMAGNQQSQPNVGFGR